VALSKKQVKKLGDRLRHGSVPSPEDMERLAQFRDEHLESMVSVFGAISLLEVPRLALTARQKNANTIIEKMRLLHTGLDRMQDIAGIRLIVDGGRSTQAAAVQEICGRFTRARVADLLATPHSGYRAVHVVVEEHGHHVEVQVRTPLQNRWAQAFERLGDHWGRQIRHGMPPDEPDRAQLIEGSAVTRAEVVDYLRDSVSPEIAEAEVFAFEIDKAREASRGGLASAEETARQRLSAAGAMFDALSGLGEMVPPSISPGASIEDDHGACIFYLVAYHRRTGALVRAVPCNDQKEVRDLRAKLEGENRGNPDFEVVLLASRSKEDLLATHARYFHGLVELAHH
jgi:ppGpp synthetase/RelA/SpoT-type nucleotidyltranferase